MTTHWPFDQPRNCAVVSRRQIVRDGAPVLFVSHDLDDHGWQFLDGQPLAMADAMLVSFSGVVDADATLLELSDLPPGWVARRQSAESPWQRQVAE